MKQTQTQWEREVPTLESNYKMERESLNKYSKEKIVYLMTSIFIVSSKSNNKDKEKNFKKKK